MISILTAEFSRMKNETLIICDRRLTVQILNLIPNLFMLAIWDAITRSETFHSLGFCFSMFLIGQLILSILSYPPEFLLFDEGIIIKKLGNKQFYRWEKINFAIEYGHRSPRFYQRLAIGSKSFSWTRILYAFDLFRWCPIYRISFITHHNYKEATAFIEKKINGRYRKSRWFG